jgi:hypothetical protein
VRLVPLVVIEYPILGGHGRDLGHDLRHGFRRPVEGMLVLIPCTNERFDRRLEERCRFNISDTQAFALDDAEPLFHLIHPCAVDRRAMEDNAWMFRQPLAYFLTVMCADMIAHAMNRLDMVTNGRSPLFQQGDECLLTRTGGTVPKDGARTGLDCRKYIQRPAALVFMFLAARNVPWWRGPRRRETRTRLQGGFLIN